MRLNLFMAPKSSEEDLLALIESMRKTSTGYESGVDVTKKDKISGKYEIARYNQGHTLEVFCVRALGRLLITGKDGTSMIEQMLKDNRIEFRRYNDIEVENPDKKERGFHVGKSMTSEHFVP